MIPDDVFDRQRETLRATMARWFEAFGADIQSISEETPTYTRLAGLPRARGACRVDLVIDVKHQKLDLEIGSETYEGLVARDITGYAALFDAASAGIVTTRRWKRLSSGQHIATDTAFDASPAAADVVTRNGWQLRQIIDGRDARDIAAALAEDLRYTPWSR